MITGIYTSTAGMLIQEREQNVIANNIANVNTTGFKRMLAVFQEKPEEEITKFEKSEDSAFYPYLDEQVIGKVGQGVIVQKTAEDFSAGPIRQTGNDFDFAIKGEGLFPVEGPGKEIFFTRAGEFTLNEKGELVTQQGYRVLGVVGEGFEDGMEAINKKGEVLFPLEPIELGNVEGKVTVDNKGRIYINNDYAGINLKTFRPQKKGFLHPYGNNLFKIYGDSSVVFDDKSQIMQGYIEGSNVNSVKEMVRMIEMMRLYEFNQKLIRTQDETLGKLVTRMGIR